MERSLKKIEPGSPRSQRPPGCLAARGFRIVNSTLTIELFAKKLILEKKEAKLGLFRYLNLPSTFRVVLSGPLVSKKILSVSGSYFVSESIVSTVLLFVLSTISFPSIRTRSKGLKIRVFTKKEAVPVSTRR